MSTRTPDQDIDRSIFPNHYSEAHKLYNALLLKLFKFGPQSREDT